MLSNGESGFGIVVVVMMPELGSSRVEKKGEKCVRTSYVVDSSIQEVLAEGEEIGFSPLSFSRCSFRW